MLEIRIIAGWALVGLCFILALIWLITLFTRVRQISWICVFGAPVAFGLGDELLQPSGIGFFPFVITVLALAFIPAVITGIVQNKQVEKENEKRRQKEKIAQKQRTAAAQAVHEDAIKQMRQSEKYRHMKNCLPLLLKEDRVLKVEVGEKEWKETEHGVIVRYTESSPPYRWDAAAGRWISKPTKTVYFFERGPYDRAYTEEERIIIGNIVDAFISKYARWAKSIRGETEMVTNIVEGEVCHRALWVGEKVVEWTRLTPEEERNYTPY